jgi:hemerythrin-like domain-containing protein
MMGMFSMRLDEILIERRRQLEEERKKKEREPYEKIIRRLRKRDEQRAILEQLPSNGKS